MSKLSGKNNLDDYDDSPLTEEELKRMRPMREVDPALVAAHKAGALRYGGRPAGRSKEAINLSLDLDLIEALRRSGRGWQTRANAMLRRSMKLPPRQKPLAASKKHNKTLSRKRSRG